MHARIEPLSDHPLFRALVLMGGALAIGCGGVAERDAPGGASEMSHGGSASGAAAGATSVAGSGSAMGGASVGPATQTGTAGSVSTASTAGTAGTNAEAFYNPTCPYEQWDCAAAPPATACYFYLKSKDDPLAAGCKCDPARPKSASACKADEQFVCRQAYPPYVEAQPGPRTWDGALHVQCACVVAPVPTWENCDAACRGTFNDSNSTQCRLPSGSTCSEDGVCTATSADVLRQDGIMCGCADIGIK